MRKIIIAVAIFLLCFLLVGGMQSNNFEVTEYTIANEKVNDNLMIVQVSDFHNSEKYVNSLSEKIIELDPNYIVFTGDLIDYYKPNIDVSVQLISNIADVAPIYYVQGNHEYFSDCYDELKEKLLEQNVVVLEDEFVELENLNIIGLLDDSATFVETNNENFTLLLAHRPELFESYINMGVDLVLSGHTHGGQLCLPVIGGFYAPNQGFFPKYIAGMYQENNTTMIVSRGIGNGRIPFRIYNKPELVVIRIN